MRGAPRRARQRQGVLSSTDEVSLRLHIVPLKEGGYLATSSDVPGLVAEGRSITEAAEIARGLARKIAESCLEHGDPLPAALAPRPRRAVDLLVPLGVR
ncbi:MAG: type II toxin-antitoxin system HicB family antitoxin [Planctomycetota bacterium]|nr:type II toxin-antitoxin system HicB family antitoxin [Planctomycetota bacterium]